MDLHYLIDGLLIVALVGWMLYRQMTWRVVDPGRLWRPPLILGVIGVITIMSSKSTSLDTLDLAVLVGELAVSVGFGAVMGAIAHFRPLTPQAIAAYEARRSQQSRRPSAAAAPVRFESRTGWFGIVLWVLLIALRVGIEFGAAHLGAAAISSTGIILLVLAANRAARVAVFSYRISRHPASIAARV